MSDEEFRSQLLNCLDVPRWADEVIAAGPFSSVSDLVFVAQEAARWLSPDDIEQALSAHPRIGDQPKGDSVSAELSRSEQSAEDSEDAKLAAELDAGNEAYEQRFQRVFLIRAAGRSRQDVVDELHRRMGNDDDTELAEVRQQLAEIATGRIEKLFAENTEETTMNEERTDDDVVDEGAVSHEHAEEQGFFDESPSDSVEESPSDSFDDILAAGVAAADEPESTESDEPESTESAESAESDQTEPESDESLAEAEEPGEASGDPEWSDDGGAEDVSDYSGLEEGVAEFIEVTDYVEVDENGEIDQFIEVTEIVDVDENGDVVGVTEVVEVLDVVDEDTEVLIPAAPVVEDSPWSPPVWAADVPVLTDLPEPEPQPEPAPVFENSRLSAHVLDTAKGAPAVGVAVALLEQPEENIGSWIPLALGVSDAAGRIGQLSDGPLQPGIYRLLVESGAYWQDQGVTGFYPEIVVTFEVAEDAHLHIPLLLSPFGFSTYRGV